MYLGLFRKQSGWSVCACYCGSPIPVRSFGNETLRQPERERKRETKAEGQKIGAIIFPDSTCGSVDFFHLLA